MNDDILEHWLFPYEPRQNQITALNWLQEQTAKFLLLEIPVGGGKSNLALTFSHWLQNEKKKSAFIITPQRILQEQYEESFKDNKNYRLQCLYGKSNYKCHSKETTCDVGGLLKPLCKHCPHMAAKMAAKESQNAVLNYSLALTSFAYTNVFTRRNLLVFDECHSIEDHLVGFDAVEITNRRCEKYGWKFKTQIKISEAIEWIKSYYLGVVKDKLEELQIKYEGIREKPSDKLSWYDIGKLRELDKLAAHYDEIKILTLRKSEYTVNNFVLVNSIDRFQFKRLNGAYSFNKIVMPFADRFLFMSSTILDQSGFCDDIGIDPKESSMLSLKSEFPVEQRPVYYKPAMRMNKDWNKDANAQKRDKSIEKIKRILKDHEGESGLIHTGNFGVARWLVEKLDKGHHEIFHHNPGKSKGINRNTAITSFIKCKKPALLISPSSTEGLDLKDDLGRFAIIMKVPFGSLGDQWIKRKMELSNKWYRRRALIDIIQGGGRIVRSEKDMGTVYILDGSFGFLLNQSRAMVPEWWNESFIRL